MSLGGAERWGLFGGILLLGAFLSAGLIFLLQGGEGPPKPRPEKPPEARDPDTGPPVEPPGERPVEPPAEEPPEAPPENEPFSRERARLQTRIQELQNEVAKLKARLEEAGVPLEEPPPDPKLVAERALDELRRCGPGTDPRDIEEIVTRIVEAGPGAVEPLEKFLKEGPDVAYSEAWTFLGGHFVGYPGLRIALLSALDRIGGVEGQSAILTVLSTTESPLEICIAFHYLDGLEKTVPAVADAEEEAARRYLDMVPPRGESLLVRPVLLALGRQEPGRAAESFLSFVRSEHRSPEKVESALQMISRLPEVTSIAALLSVAADESLGEKGVRAARILAGSGYGGAVAALGRLLSGDAATPAVRREVYRQIDVPVDRALDELLRSPSREGLKALAEADRILSDLKARNDLLVAQESREKDRTLRRILTSALQKFDAHKKAAEEFRSRIAGD